LSRANGQDLESHVFQVALNQLALGPVVLAVSFAWNLVLTGQANKYVSKLRNDGPPSMVNGALCHHSKQDGTCSWQPLVSVATL
jgi:hypothetical protein